MEEMNKKLSDIKCSVVKDLLPLYQDDALRDESREFVEEHLKNCRDCNQYKTDMEQLKISTVPVTSEGTVNGLLHSEEEEAAHMKKLASRLRSRRRKVIIGIAAGMLFAFIIYTYLFQTAQISGMSMEPNYRSGQSILVNRLAYLIASPKRGDVITYYNNDGQIFIKRIAGIPGDKIEVTGNTLLINDKPAQSKQISSFINDAGDVIYPIILGKDEYFVLGDNLENSSDSRYVENGNVSRDKIIGKVICKTIPNFLVKTDGKQTRSDHNNIGNE